MFVSDLRTAAQQAVMVLGNARDYIYLQEPGWSEETQLEEIRQAIAALRAALVENREHITDGTPCWCQPELDYVDPDTGTMVWIHKEPQ